MRNVRQLGNIVILEFLKKFSGDIYIIALPAIAASFNTDRQHVQIMISLFLIGVAISQFISGSLSDQVGRRPVLLSCLLVFLVGSLVCASGHSVPMLLVGIFVMGMGIGSAPTIGKAMIHDLYKHSGKTALFLVITSSFVVWAPAIAMAVGGNFAHYLGWQSIFWLSGVLGIIAFIITLVMLRETRSSQAKPALKILGLFQQYSIALCHGPFTLSLISLALIASGVFVFYSAGLFVLNHSLNIPLNVVGYLVFTLAAGNFGGKFFGGFLSFKLKPFKALLLTTSMGFGFAFVMLLFAVLHETNVFVIVIPMIGYMFSLGATMPIARTNLMDLLGDQAGTASGLTGIMIAITASIMTFVTSHFHIENIIPVASILSLITFFALVCFIIAKR